MNQFIPKRLAVAAIALLALPATLLAQDDTKEKEKKDVQQIIITRTGDRSVKTTIEIDGDKVKVNGKDIKDDANVKVRVNTMTRNSIRTGADGQWNMFNGSAMIEDANRAMLGVVTEANEKGAEIQSITRESGADKAGMKKGDIITMVGDKKIESTDDVSKAVRAHKPGDKVSVTFLRDGKEQKATAELTKWKGININTMTMPQLESIQGYGAMSPLPPNVSTFTFDNRPRLGLSIQDTEDGGGVKVLDVDDDGNAAKAGLKEGDIITGIDDHEVHTTDDLTRTIRDTKGKYTFTLRVNRGGKMQNIEVKLPRKLKTANL